jgi:transcriptional regulator NrdR family protein
MTPRQRRGFVCDRCESNDLIVVDSRWSNRRGAIWRRRECRDCGFRKTYWEWPESDEAPDLTTRSIAHSR